MSVEASWKPAQWNREGEGWAEQSGFTSSRILKLWHWYFYLSK